MIERYLRSTAQRSATTARRRSKQASRLWTCVPLPLRFVWHVCFLSSPFFWLAASFRLVLFRFVSFHFAAAAAMLYDFCSSAIRNGPHRTAAVVCCSWLRITTHAKARGAERARLRELRNAQGGLSFLSRVMIRIWVTVARVGGIAGRGGA